MKTEETVREECFSPPAEINEKSVMKTCETVIPYLLHNSSYCDMSHFCFINIFKIMSIKIETQCIIDFFLYIYIKGALYDFVC